MMTPREADKAIRSGKIITVRDPSGDTFHIRLVSRTRWHVFGHYRYGEHEVLGKFERSDLTLVPD